MEKDSAKESFEAAGWKIYEFEDFKMKFHEIISDLSLPVGDEDECEIEEVVDILERL